MFHARAADQAHAASMPGTTWPVIGHPPGPAPAARSMATVSMPRLNVTTRQQRFGFTHLPGPHLTPHWCLFHIAHHDGLQPTQHVVVWSLPPKGDSEGPAFISRTAPTPGGLTYLRIKTSVRRSWRTPRRSLVIGPMSGSLRTTLRPLTIAEAAVFTAAWPRGLNRTNHDESRERRGPGPDLDHPPAE